MINKSIILSLCLIFYCPTSANDGIQTQPTKNITESSVLIAQNSKKRRRKVVKGSRGELIQALNLAKRGKYLDASVKLFQLSHSPRFRNKKMQIKYILGLMLYQMKLNQISAFQFISVVKNGSNKYLKQSLEKLSLAADFLGDDTLLNYAISRVKVGEFPRVHRDMLYYRIGEFQMRNKQYREATRSLSRVNEDSVFYARAKYQQGLAYAVLKRNAKAMNAFDMMIDSRRGKGITDQSRVAGLMGKARIYYQGKNWDEAIEYYRQIPRDFLVFEG